MELLVNGLLKNKRDWTDDKSQITEVADNIECLRVSYRNLKQTFDSAADYQLANNFHAGELWAQWKEDSVNSHFLLKPLEAGLFHWHWWYHVVSDFGQSYWKPLKIWITFVFLFGLIYYAFGLVPGSVPKVTGEILPLKEWHLPRDMATEINNAIEALRLSLARQCLADPKLDEGQVGPANWVFQLLQKLVTAVVIPFFVLALRRRLKR